MRTFARLTGNRGFTLLEMIIVVAVLAILVSISTPAIFKFMQQRDIQAEQNTQAEIVKAMQAYIADKGQLPADYVAGDPTYWAKQLAGYTNLSQNDIMVDTWGNDRTYLMYQNNTRNIMGTNVPVYYATVISKGPDTQAANKTFDGTTITGIALNGKNFAAVTDAGWWSNQSTDTLVTNQFSALSTGGDDIMVRFTDYADKLDAYNKTLDRLDRLGQALETYARNGYAQKTVACTSTPTDPTCMNGYPEQLIYYPRSSDSNAPADSANYVNTTVIVADNNADDARRTQMKTLVRQLGLPDDFCCSAVQLGTDSLPKPFYYFSNPRPRVATGNGCGTRPVATGIKLPARLTTVNDSNTCG